MGLLDGIDCGQEPVEEAGWDVVTGRDWLGRMVMTMLVQLVRFGRGKEVTRQCIVGRGP